MVVVFLLNMLSVAVSYAMDNIPYSENDITVLKSILTLSKNNMNTLEWEISNPGNIENVEWKNINNTYYLTALDLSNIEIDGNIDLGKCTNLTECYFENTNIVSVILPASCQNLTNNSFKNCSNLECITINADNMSIGSSAFSGCISLNAIVNAQKITYIGRNAFYNCENIVFYNSDSSENKYIEKYVADYNFSMENSTEAISYGYIGRMYSPTSTKSSSYYMFLPYITGRVSLYTNEKELIETIDIDKTGRFEFEELTVGQLYRLVIDGDTAIAREVYFTPSDSEYCISEKTDCIEINVCDYNMDGLISYADLKIMSKHVNGMYSSSEDSIYDFNYDGSINSIDITIAIQMFSTLYYDFSYE